MKKRIAVVSLVILLLAIGSLGLISLAQGQGAGDIQILQVYESEALYSAEGALSVTIDIEGYRWTIGGLPLDYSKQDIINYVLADYTDILRQAQLAEGDPAPVLDIGNRPDLITYTADTLPQSQHIAKIMDITLGLNYPVTVARKYMGEVYRCDCAVSTTVANLYQDGDIGVGDYVIVSYITENLYGTERTFCIVVDGVHGNWQ